MGVWTAQENDFLRATKRDVGDELAAAAQMAIVLLARD
jgi:hypothetical protein